ncbi:MAG: HAD family hydrolase [Candidatus Hadarchaeota archaeon]
MTKLVLFDVDQTLVDALEHHNYGYSKAMKEVFGVDAQLTEIKFAGKIVPNIIRELGELKGISKDVVESRLAEAVEKVEHFAKEAVNKNHVKVLAGVVQLLEKLRERKHVIGILTGSPKAVTESILEKAGLKKYFDIMVFGPEGKSRVELVGVAVARAEGKTGRRFSGKDLVTIGDSIHDIDCGKPYGAVTIAVATGFHSREELMEHSPDYLFRDLTDPKILEVLA